MNLNGVWISLNNSYTSLFHLKALGFSAVCPSVIFVKFVDDVTLVDEDTNSIPTTGNPRQSWPFCDQCNWRHLVAKCVTNAWILCAPTQKHLSEGLSEGVEEDF